MKTTVRLLAVILALLLPAACGGDEPEAGETEETEEAASGQTLDIEIKSTGDRFEYVAPDEIEAGAVEMNVKNSTDLFLQAQLVRIEGDHTREEIETAITSDEAVIPEWLSAPGGVVYIHAGEEKSGTVVLEEGTYYLTDPDTLADSREAPPEGAGESPSAAASASPTASAAASAGPSPSTGPEVPGGTDENEQASSDEDSPLTSLGLFKELTVTAGDDEGELPEADATIIAKEYEFEIPEMKAGTTSIEFRNEGKELHHVIAFPLLPDATSADVDAFVKAVAGETQGPGGPPPFDFANTDGVAVIDGGLSQTTEIELKEGKYAFVCFLTDRAGGPPHLGKGMVEEITVSS